MRDADERWDAAEPTAAELGAAEREVERLEPAAPGEDALAGDTVSLDQLEPDLSDDIGAESAMQAAEDAEPWFPPTDPVLVPDANDRGGADPLGEFSPTADEEFRAGGDLGDAVLTDDDLAAAVTDALARDATTSLLRVRPIVAGSVVTLRGEVDHLVDSDAAEAVAGRVPGVSEVREELTVRGIDGA